MSLYDNYRNTEYLDDVSFIGGTDFSFEFPLYTEGGNAISINGATMRWFLSLYGQPEYTILEKTALNSGSSMFIVKLNPADTYYLNGVYLQQMEITDISGSKTRPAQGIVIIRKAIPGTGE